MKLDTKINAWSTLCYNFRQWIIGHKHVLIHVAQYASPIRESKYTLEIIIAFKLPNVPHKKTITIGLSASTAFKIVN